MKYFKIAFVVIGTLNVLVNLIENNLPAVLGWGCALVYAIDEITNTSKTTP